ncbi:SGNH/GDSL hydrolase family protein [Sansalvadorimonas sp. 2012CJ34-2]|uniref:SGNH/GDSL hydrolase family protein n=1 Tax=Parendozoicomonas callyspongiae TaxID=2942213 RepID=A0ABT0PEK8_9GAMM|nr:SGNH/GDSL hydrolase family protein [Sansalvadorimonas sp. 2012CJ34-2]MCL6269691.1 SGNH/GDSL hydrolase family protein [Sansalvadorimonas sp. 2012CJ34-2]
MPASLHPKHLPQLFLAILLFLQSAVTFSHEETTKSINIHGLVIFGDSLSDNSNTWRISYYYSGLPDPLNENYQTNNFLDFFDGFLPWAVSTVGPSIVPFPQYPAPPYYQGYFTNGPVTVDFLADYAGLDRSDPSQYRNLAFGASWSTGLFDSLIQSIERGQAPELRVLFQGKVLPPNFTQVTNVYLKHNPRLSPDIIYAVYFSGNDYLNGFSDPATVVSTQYANIRRLIDAGARHIFWGTVPAYEMAPCFRSGPRREIVSRWGKQHNSYVRRLAQGITKAWPHVKLTVGDIADIFRKTANDPANGFTEIYAPCTNVFIPGCDFEPSMVTIFNTCEATVCEKPDQYLFWDQVHATTKAHEIVSGYVCRELLENGYKLDCPDMETLRKR